MLLQGLIAILAKLWLSFVNLFSIYEQVRIKAQKMLFACFDIFDYSARAVLPGVLDKLKDDPVISHEQFKVSCTSTTSSSIQVEVGNCIEYFNVYLIFIMFTLFKMSFYLSVFTPLDISLSSYQQGDIIARNLIFSIFFR